MTKDENLEELKRRRELDDWGSPSNIGLIIGGIFFLLGFGAQLVILFMMNNGPLTPAEVPSWVDWASYSSIIVSFVIMAVSIAYWRKGDPFNKDLRREIVMDSGHDDQFCLKYRVGDNHKKLPVKFKKHLSNGKIRVVLDATPGMLTTEKIEEIRSNT